MQTETPVPPPESDSASAIDTETTNDFSGLILMITAILALGFRRAGPFSSSRIVMIFMHELGHYLTALDRHEGHGVLHRSWTPTLVVPQGRDRIRRQGIPAGAYVRIIGMNNLDPVEPGDEQRSYRIKSWPRKMLVVSAGSAMHFIGRSFCLAVPLFYGVQNDDGAWQVSRTSQASAAAELGIEPGDVMLSVGGGGGRRLPAVRRSRPSPWG